jgi:uncharacterized protein YbjQ (UPF0145 family)
MFHRLSHCDKITAIMLKLLARAGLVLTTLLAGTHAVVAADEVLMMPIAAALTSTDGRAKVDGDVKFFFGRNKPVRISHQYGNFIANNKAHVLGRSTAEACNLAFLNALEDLQKKARSVGANAVSGVVSYFRRRETTSDDSFECNVGSVVAGVALKGDLVKGD